VTPLLLSEVEPGPTPITLRLDGYEDLRTTVEVEAGQRKAVLGQLKQGTGTLRILVKPWGTIYIDDALHKREANIWSTATLSAGNHRVRIEHPSLGRWEQVVEVVSGEERSLTIDFNDN
jgi:serine/threonine-protein kinase